MSGRSSNRVFVVRVEARLPRELGVRFKEEAYKRRGYRKGAISEALIEAVKLYLEGSRRDIEGYFADVRHEGLKRKLSKYGKEAPKGISPETYALVMATIEVLKEFGDKRAETLGKKLREVIRLHGR